MLEKSIHVKTIFGDGYNIVFNKFKLDPSHCRGFILDSCGANLKALSVLPTPCMNAVSIRCMSHLFNNTDE